MFFKKEEKQRSSTVRTFEAPHLPLPFLPGVTPILHFVFFVSLFFKKFNHICRYSWILPCHFEFYLNKIVLYVGSASCLFSLNVTFMSYIHVGICSCDSCIFMDDDIQLMTVQRCTRLASCSWILGCFQIFLWPKMLLRVFSRIHVTNTFVKCAANTWSGIVGS